MFFYLFYRINIIIYYIFSANTAARTCVKKEVASKYAVRETFNYNKTIWKDGAKQSTELFTVFKK